MGNDFYGAIGDVFSTHCVENPDFDSQLQLVSKYAGSNVDKPTLEKLVLAFSQLRDLHIDGTLNYPYSTRELVSIVKHISAFPRDGISRALRNVFDFDAYTPDTLDIIIEVFGKQGIPLSNSEQQFSIRTAEIIKLPTKRLIQEWERGPPMSIRGKPHGMYVKVV